ncbi:MAG: metallopeptidase family protein [Actinomycetota bacterium]
MGSKRKAGWSEYMAGESAARRRFEELVADAIDALPEEISAAMSNVAVVVEDGGAPKDTLGLYQGIPQPDRDAGYTGALPDVITIYRRPIEARARTPEELADEVRTTVFHEVAHHFGIDDERLRELGWD